MPNVQLNGRPTNHLLLHTPESKTILEQLLEEDATRHTLLIARYVFLPGHVHLLVDEPPLTPLATVLQVLKQTTSHRLKHPDHDHLWQTPYNDLTKPETPPSRQQSL